MQFVGSNKDPSACGVFHESLLLVLCFAMGTKGTRPESRSREAPVECPRGDRDVCRRVDWILTIASAGKILGSIMVAASVVASGIVGGLACLDWFWLWLDNSVQGPLGGPAWSCFIFAWIFIGSSLGGLRGTSCLPGMENSHSAQDHYGVGLARLF